VENIITATISIVSRITVPRIAAFLCGFNHIDYNVAGFVFFVDTGY